MRYEHLGASTDDVALGSVRVTWQGVELSNLYIAIIELRNNSVVDLVDVVAVAYSFEDTTILTERTEIVGEPQILDWTDDYRTKVSVPDGQNPTTAQQQLRRHRREYKIPVMNRGQRVRSSGEFPAGSAGPVPWPARETPSCAVR